MRGVYSNEKEGSMMRSNELFKADVASDELTGSTTAQNTGIFDNTDLGKISAI
jgi:hypothetical protein